MNRMRSAGRHLLQISGSSPVPGSTVRAIDTQAIDDRYACFEVFGNRLYSRIQYIFQTLQPVIIYRATGAGECKATLVNAATDCSEVAIPTR